MIPQTDFNQIRNGRLTWHKSEGLKFYP